MLQLISRNATDALPVSLTEMAQHLKREDTDEDDDYINACLLAAIDWAERFSGQVMVDSTYELSLDSFPGGSVQLTPMLGGNTTIYLRRAPLLEVISVTYRDVGGASTVLGTGGYGVDYAGSSIYLPLSTSWPGTDGAANAVTVRFRAGFLDYLGSPTTGVEVPELLKQAIKIYAAEFYGNRDNEQLSTPTRIPYGAEYFLRYFRIDDSLA